jgi:hypothetical protein
VRYTYLRHTADRIIDPFNAAAEKSFLTRTPSGQVTSSSLMANAKDKSYLTSWRNNYLTFELTYNSAQAMNNWVLSPNVCLAYDHPLGGPGTAKTHQVTLSIALHF